MVIRNPGYLPVITKKKHSEMNFDRLELFFFFLGRLLGKRDLDLELVDRLGNGGENAGSRFPDRLLERKNKHENQLIFRARLDLRS